MTPKQPQRVGQKSKDALADFTAPGSPKRPHLHRDGQQRHAGLRQADPAAGRVLRQPGPVQHLLRQVALHLRVEGLPPAHLLLPHARHVLRQPRGLAHVQLGPAAAADALRQQQAVRRRQPGKWRNKDRGVKG